MELQENGGGKELKIRTFVICVRIRYASLDIGSGGGSGGGGSGGGGSGDGRSGDTVTGHPTSFRDRINVLRQLSLLAGAPY